MRILYGMVRPDAGTIEIDGAPTDIADPAMAIQLGIGMVHQRFQLVDELTAVENLVLGRVPCRFGPIFDRRRALAEAEQLAATLGTRMPWMRPVRDLGVGDKQRLEIIRLLYHRADVLIFDEPTGVLTPRRQLNSLPSCGAWPRPAARSSSSPTSSARSWRWRTRSRLFAGGGSSGPVVRTRPMPPRSPRSLSASSWRRGRH